MTGWGCAWQTERPATDCGPGSVGLSAVQAVRLARACSGGVPVLPLNGMPRRTAALFLCIATRIIIMPGHVDPGRIAEQAVRRMEQGWNEADGDTYAAPFAEEADFVDIRGAHHRGRARIADGHQAIFDTIYRGSRLEMQVVDARALEDQVVLARVRAEMDAPTGPLAGRNAAMMTLVLARAEEGWEVVSAHNTAVAPPPTPRPGP